MTGRIVAILLLCAAASFAGGPKMSLIGSQHDLSPSGSGPVKSAEPDACVFCHAPHNIVPNITPLWDHALSSQTYTTYTSSTYQSGAQNPGAGSSRLCLSCHDGTVAPGLTVAKGLIPTTGSMSGSDVFGSNLATSHPVSMTPVDDGSLVTSLFANPPSTRDPAVKLVSGKVECTTCHDPHVPNNDRSVPMFLARSNASGTLCLACHDPGRAQPNALNGWTGGSHATATNTVPVTSGFGKYGSVASNACSNCHYGHNNGAGPRNLAKPEEAACSACHSGTNLSPAPLNVMGEFTKVYSHPVTTIAGVHDPAETLPVNNARHSECADCHNSHAAAAQSTIPVAPALQASLAGVKGWDTSGAVTVSTTEYQICLKCHSDSTNKPTSSSYGRTAPRYPAGPMPAGYPIQPPRPSDQYNLRLKFTSSIGHNVMGFSLVTTANNTLRPFMLNVDGATSNNSRPLSTTTRLYCTDCHNNDKARSSNGNGPNGPHGSTFPHLLQFNLFQDGTGGGGGGGGATGSALCNKCHDISKVNGIRPHDDHNGVGCTTCHDPHGVIGGNPGANRAMMNFDTGVANKATTYFGYYYNSPTQRGCYTTCHGESHNPRPY